MAFDAVARAIASQALSLQPRGIEAYGAAPTASGPQNTAALRDALAGGAAALKLVGGTYSLSAIAATDIVTMRRSGQQPAMLLPRQLKLLDGGKATLRLGPCLGILAAPYVSYDYPEVRSYLGADVAAGATSVVVVPGDGTKWQPGDEFVYRFGSLPYDRPEPLQWGIGKVRAVSGDTLTLEAPLPDGFAIASVAGATFTDEFAVAGRTNKTLHKWPLLADLTIRDLEVIGTTGPGITEIGLYVQGGRRVTFNRVKARSVGTGFVLQYVDGALIDSCTAIDNTAATNPSLGNGIGLAETRGVEVRNFACSGVRQVIAAEAQSEAWVSGGRFDNTGSPADGSSYGAQSIAFSALGQSQLTVRDFTITGHGGYVLAEVSNGSPAYDGRVRFEGRLTLSHPTMPASLGRLTDMNCLLDLRIGAAREMWDFTATRWFTRRIWLRNGLYRNIVFPPGILRQVQVYASADAAPGTGLTDLYIGRTGDNGSSYVGQLVAGRTIAIPMLSDASAVFARRGEQVKLLAITASGSSLDAAGAFVDVHCEIVPDLLAPGFTWSSDDDARNAGPGGGAREARFTGYDLPGLAAAGATTQAVFAIPGMAAGDLIEAVSFNIDRGGITLRDAQAIAGSCRITFENLTGAAIDLGAATVRILWRKSPGDN